MWDALTDICTREGMTLSELAAEVDIRRPRNTHVTLASSVRVLIIGYYRAAAVRSETAAGNGAIIMAALNEAIP